MLAASCILPHEFQWSLPDGLCGKQKMILKLLRHLEAHYLVIPLQNLSVDGRVVV